MNLFYRIKEKMQCVFFHKDRNQGRRSRREPFDMQVTYVSGAVGEVSGQARVLNVNKDGVCLELDRELPENAEISVKINPYALLRHIGFDRVQLDEEGRYLTKVVWEKGRDDGEGYVAGCVFVKRADR